MRGFLRRNNLSTRLFFAGLIILSIYIGISIFVPLLITLEIVPNGEFGLGNPIFSAPSIDHWCGTDRLGRDVCIRTLAASGVALQVVFVAVSLAVLVGIPLGLLSGYIGGLVDRVLVLFMDTLYTIPVLLLSVVMAFLLGRGILNASIALCVVYIPQYFRLVRNQTSQVKSELYIEAAISMGASPLWVIRKYLLKNVLTSVPVVLTLNAADAVLVLGGLGFLGLGLPENIPEWGSDLNMALVALPTGIWWTAIYPGMAMFVLVLGLSFIGEGLEKILSETSLQN
ncbi:putative ABC transporter, oligopeptides [Prochlorococcus marinus str. NATL2A]|uniref:ABC transporter, oligopeptides n=1 Tax=Prochlorococcus marinus (strain NATL2A) TaxID=59920 RepID=Q46GZ5_PROMT|nr:putative ABC transporter, oligopeptides [Prochlorococcus marinus str. NATL2A]